MRSNVATCSIAVLNFQPENFEIFVREFRKIHLILLSGR